MAFPLNLLGGDNEQGSFGPGDNLQLEVVGYPELNGLYTLDDAGRVDLKLVGTISLAGQKTEEAARTLEELYRDGYLRFPQVIVVRIPISPPPSKNPPVSPSKTAPPASFENSQKGKSKKISSAPASPTTPLMPKSLTLTIPPPHPVTVTAQSSSTPPLQSPPQKIIFARVKPLGPDSDSPKSLEKKVETPNIPLPNKGEKGKKGQKTYLHIVDNDTEIPLPGAVVRVGWLVYRADSKGRVLIEDPSLFWRKSLRVLVPGYQPHGGQFQEIYQSVVTVRLQKRTKSLKFKNLKEVGAFLKVENPPPTLPTQKEIGTSSEVRSESVATIPVSIINEILPPPILENFKNLVGIATGTGTALAVPGDKIKRLPPSENSPKILNSSKNNLEKGPVLKVIFKDSLTNQQIPNLQVQLGSNSELETNSSGELQIPSNQLKEEESLWTISEHYFSKQFVLKKPYPKGGIVFLLVKRPLVEVGKIHLSVFNQKDRKPIIYPQLHFNGRWFSGDKNGIIELEGLKGGYYKGNLLASGFSQSEIIFRVDPKSVQKLGQNPFFLTPETKPELTLKEEFSTVSLGGENHNNKESNEGKN